MANCIRLRQTMFIHVKIQQSAPPGPTAARLVLGSLASDLGAPWFRSRGHPVSLPVETPASGAPKQEAAFYRPSHAARAVIAIDAPSGAAREEMIDLVAASTRRVCRDYGVWMGPEKTAPLWLVSERHSPGVYVDGEEVVGRIGAVGMEVCEALVGLHGEGLVLGCLGMDCFCLDRFGHCLLDLNQALALYRGIRAGACSSKAGAIIAPEVAASKLRMKDRDFSGFGRV